MERIKNQKTYLLIILTMFILYIIFGRGVGVNKCNRINSSPPSSPIIQQTLDSISTRFELKGDHRDFFLQNIVLGEEATFAFGNINDESNLFSMNTITGNINWQTCAFGVMAVGTDYVFSSYTGDISGAYVIAFDKESGTEVW